jgi:UDP-glucose:(heptosyl)LPS alpha-1,3-glucosyltransferase
VKKKLAILLFKYFPYGGLQKDFLGVADELISRGHELKVFTRSWEGSIPEGLDVITLGERGKSNYTKNKNFVKAAYHSVQDFSPDIIFGFNKMPGLDLYFAADTCFAKQALKKNKLQKFTRRFKQSMQFEKDVFSKESDTKILSLNESQANEFKDFYSTQHERITIVPPGINKNWTDHDPLNIYNVLNIPLGEKILLFVGSDFSRKGLDRAIHAVNHLNEKDISSNLVIIGDDNPKPYERLIATASLSDKVFFLGPRKDVASFMKSADLLIHPAREEAAGNIIIEAIVSGLPSLVTSEVGFSNEVLKYKSGTVLKGEFNQNRFNMLIEKSITDKKLSLVRDSINNLQNKEYFFSRFKFIADYIEETFQ